MSWKGVITTAASANCVLLELITIILFYISDVQTGIRGKEYVSLLPIIFILL